MENKTHYRKVFKSDHLGVADLEEMIETGTTKLIFVIKEVRQEIQTKVAGKKIDANIAYFTDSKIKPLVLNSTNSKQIAKFANSSFIEDWANLPIELFIDNNVKMKGSIVGGVRIKSIQPILKKVKPQFTEAKFEAAFNAGATLEVIKKSYSITPEMETKYTNYATK
jgi:hypothetical protein